MSESKMIPIGPWTRSGHEQYYGGDVFVYSADRRCLARVLSPFADDGGDTRIAVADMMRAAPELYEALTKLTHAMDTLIHEGVDRGKGHWPAWDDCARAVDAARAALIKASGGSDV